MLYKSTETVQDVVKAGHTLLFGTCLQTFKHQSLVKVTESAVGVLVHVSCCSLLKWITYTVLNHKHTCVTVFFGSCWCTKNLYTKNTGFPSVVI